MLSPTVLSLSISKILGTQPLPILSISNPLFSVTCDCCGSRYVFSD